MGQLISKKWSQWSLIPRKTLRMLKPTSSRQPSPFFRFANIILPDSISPPPIPANAKSFAAAKETLGKRAELWESVEENLWNEAAFGDLDDHLSCVKAILEKNPELDVNWQNEGLSALHYACFAGKDLCHGHDKIVSLLLDHPNIDVNLKGIFGFTPFMVACFRGSTLCACLFLRDPRAEVNEPDNDGYTPLFWATAFGHLDKIKWWIASEREMDLGEPGNDKVDAIGVAKIVLAHGAEEANESKVAIVSLLERFRDTPERTRNEVKRELGL